MNFRTHSVVVLALVVTVAAVPASAQIEEPPRDEWQRASDIFELLGAEPGARIADVGAGGGFYTFRLSRAVGEAGRVFAVDIVESRVRRLRADLEEDGIRNVELILGRTDDPRLPFETLDGALIVNAYHEMDEYRSMLAHIRRALRPGGRLVIVDNPPDPDAADRTAQTADHEIAIDLVVDDLREADFELVERDPDFVDAEHEGHTHRNWLLVAARPERDAPIQRLDGAPEGTPGLFACAFPGTRGELVERPSPPDSTELRLAAGARIKICYSRPSARGRTIMGGLVPFGEAWRTGANEPTLIRTDAPVSIGDVEVRPGWHSLYTVPGEDGWTVVVNRLVNRPGVPIDAWVRSHDEGRFTVVPERTEGPVETLTMTLRRAGADRAELVLEWERTRVRVPVLAGTGGVD